MPLHVRKDAAQREVCGNKAPPEVTGYDEALGAVRNGVCSSVVKASELLEGVAWRVVKSLLLPGMNVWCRSPHLLQYTGLHYDSSY